MKAPKTRASGTLTESAFWSMIRSHLRRLSLRWRPRNEYLISVRKPNDGSQDKRTKFIYRCELCNSWFARKDVEIDHKVECGSLKCADDVGSFIERLLVEAHGYRLLCKGCHQGHTNESRRNK